MIEKKIRVLRDIDLNTYIGFYSLVKGEVKRVLFKNQHTFNDYLKIGNFVEADVDEEEIKPIPVILPEVNEETIVEIDNTVSVKEEAIQDHNDLDEAGEPMEQCTPEDLRRDEPSYEEIERVVKGTVGEEALKEGSAPVDEIDYRDDTMAHSTDLPDVLEMDEETVVVMNNTVEEVKEDEKQLQM